MADRLCQLFQFVLFLLASRAHKQWHCHSAWRRQNVSEELQKNKQQKIVEESSNSQEINQFCAFDDRHAVNGKPLDVRVWGLMGA